MRTRRVVNEVMLLMMLMILIEGTARAVWMLQSTRCKTFVCVCVCTFGTSKECETIRGEGGQRKWFASILIRP